MESNEFDVVIVGAGVIGHSVAFRLKRTRPKLKICLLGDPMNSLMASRAAAGMLAPYGECEQGDRFFQFCRESLEKYPRFIDELVSVSGVPVYLSMAGSIMPSLSFADRWDERLKFFREEKVPHEVWTGAQVRQKLPCISPECKEAIWVGEGQVNNRQLHDSLVAASAKLGVEIMASAVTGFVRDGPSVRAAVTDSGEVRGKKFVIAGGSWSTQLGVVLGVTIPLKPIKGQMCRLRVEDDRLEYTVHGILTYIAPWREGNGYVIGSTMEDRAFDPAVEDHVIRGLIDRASALLPCLRDAPLIEAWTGLRPAAEDLMPIMGKSGAYWNLYYSTGHHRNGILQTPNQADYVAGIVLETADREIPEFSPSRYQL
ncbi:MAG: FAD-dependent oxidoreductase [Nitrospinae bacterium]|nr:FAD-dependent oxidoreductase [Nitrospinota bacterium]